MSEEDRRLATNIFYQAIEHRSKTDYILGAYIESVPDNIVVCILHVAVAQLLYLDRIPDHAAVNEAVNQTKLYKKQEASGFVNGVLRQLLRDKEADKLREPDRSDLMSYLETEYSASRDTVQLLIEAYGEEEAEQILAYRPENRFETIRTNTLRSVDAETEAFLNEKGFEWQKSIVPHCYRVYKAGNLSKTKQYSEGLYDASPEKADQKRRKKNADLIVLNDVTKPGAGFAGDTNIITIIGDDICREYPLMTKRDAADAILDAVMAIKTGRK